LAKQATSGVPTLSLLDRLSMEESNVPEGARAEKVAGAFARGYLRLVCRYCELEERIPAKEKENPYTEGEERGWAFVETARGEEAACPKCSRTHVDKIHYREIVRRYKDSVKRDLEWLFNTRRTFDYRIDSHEQIRTSVYAYGLPDITSVNIGSVNDQRRLVNVMKESVGLFERRLKNVQIHFQPVVGGSRSLQFTISGVLLMDPAPEEVRIDTVLDSSSARYEVKK
jgi:type VI secretion system protein ImpF